MSGQPATMKLILEVTDKINNSPQVAALHSKVVVLLLLIHCLLLLSLIVWALCLILAVLSVLFSFAVISLRKRALVALL